MAFTQAQLDALDDAIATGAKEVRFQDRTVVYNSTDELIKARNLVSTILNSDSMVRQTRVYTTKGI